MKVWIQLKWIRNTRYKVEIQIDYEATLAVDLPNGLKAGSKIQLKGKSIFGFLEEKISLIEDYS